MKVTNTIPNKPNIRPAIAIPFESSAIIPIIPNRIAAAGKYNALKGRYIGIKANNNHPKKPNIPQIKAIIPNVFPNFYTIYFFFY